MFPREKVVSVIPTLNEEKGIAETVTKLKGALSAYDFAIIVVDGDSIDRTVERAKGAGAIVIRQDGKGYGDALFKGFLFGLEELFANVFLTLDADGTCEPNDAPKLLDPILAREVDYWEKDARRRRAHRSKKVQQLRNFLANMEATETRYPGYPKRNDGISVSVD